MMITDLYRPLGKSGINVSPLALGCWSFGGGAYWGAQSQSDVNDVVVKALDAGINLFDTAETYNGGASEESLGIALKKRRTEAVILTKVGPHHAYRGTLIKSCEESLKRLGTDYLDLYVIHWPLNARSVAHFWGDKYTGQQPPSILEAAEAMERLKNAGKIRAAGVSNFGVKQLAEAEAGGFHADLNEITYNILSRAIEDTILPYCREHQTAVVASMALQQGLLAEMYASPADVPPHQAHSRHFSSEQGGREARHGEAGHETLVFETLNNIKQIAKEAGLSMPVMSIAWVLNRPGIASALVGCRGAAELTANLPALGLNLSPDIIGEIDRASLALYKAMGTRADYYESEQNCRTY